MDILIKAYYTVTILDPILKITEVSEVERLLSSFHEPLLKYLKQIFSMNKFAIVFNYMQKIIFVYISFVCPLINNFCAFVKPLAISLQCNFLSRPVS